MAAYHREKVDRLPIYYGAQQSVDESLIKRLGLSSREELVRHFGCDLVNIVPDYVGPRMPAWTNTNPPELLEALRKGDDGALKDYHFPEAWWYDGKTVVPKIKKARAQGYAIALGDETLGSLLTMTGVWFGWEHLLTLMMDKPAFAHRLFEKVCDFGYGMSEDMLIHGAKDSDFYWFGDDAGTQLSLLVSPRAWTDFLAPQYKRLISLASRHNLPTIIHSCGAVREVIPEMINIGISVLHPVQTAAEGMVPEELADEFGDKMMFFGGVDTQHVLPKGSPRDICDYVERLKRTLGWNNAWIASSSQLLDVDIPLDNIVAMYDYLQGR
jgi:uroporphyrinogen decarboxylase